MASEKRPAAAAAVSVGDDVLYVLSDGESVRPAKVVFVDGDRVELAVFVRGEADAGLIEHHERRGSDGHHPAVVHRVATPSARGAASEIQVPTGRPGQTQAKKTTHAPHTFHRADGDA